MTALTQFCEFLSGAVVPFPARVAASNAILDTVGVTLAGSVEPVARKVRDVVRAEGGGSALQYFWRCPLFAGAWISGLSNPD